MTSATATPKAKTPSTEGESKADRAAKRAEELRQQRKNRTPYIKIAPAEIKAENGLLKAVPTNYDPLKHRPPKKSDFVDEVDFLEFRGRLQVARGDRIRDVGQRLVAKATEIRKYGDVNTRNKAAKFEAMLEKMARIKQELAADGITGLDEKMAELLGKLTSGAPQAS